MIVLCFVLILTTCVPATFAIEQEKVVQESVTVTHLENGYYLVTTLKTYLAPVSPAGLARHVYGYKSTSLNNIYLDTLCTLKVEGEFSFDGYSSSAMSANYSYGIYDLLYSFGGGSAWCAGNTAHAKATFKSLYFIPYDLSVSLSCSPTGVLS